MNKCPICKSKFQQERIGQVICSGDCAINQILAAGKKTAAVAKKQLKADIDALKSPAELAREAQKAFNDFVRLRDSAVGCISCTKPADWVGGVWHAGHYRAAGKVPALKFNEANCHRQCSQCNYFLHGAAGAYRDGLIDRLGIDAVVWLDGEHMKKTWTSSELRGIRATYKEKLKRLKNEKR